MKRPGNWGRLASGLLWAAMVAMLPPAFGQAAKKAPAPAPGPAGIFGAATYPSKQRAAGDPALIARGAALFGINCKACHGSDLRGGDLGGPNLLRSSLVLSDKHGEAISPVIQKGRPPANGGPPMPPFPLPPQDIKALVEYIHSVAALKANQGGPPPESVKPLNILVGNASRGAQYFTDHCQGCHSVTGDLKGIATRAGTPANLQDAWVAGRRPTPPAAAGAAAAPPPTPPHPTVKVTLTGGTSIEGTLKHVDDFTVSLITSQGQYRSFTRSGAQGATSVEIQDPLQPHRRLLTQYTDQDMHDVTAYLASLK